MPMKENKAGKQQNYIPKGNGDRSGEYVSDGSTPAERRRLQELGIDSDKDLKSLRKNNIIILSKDEYSQFCSEIKTLYTNKIPTKGSIFIDKYYYRFTYNKRTELIVCNVRLDIEKYGDLINKLEKIEWN